MQRLLPALAGLAALVLSVCGPAFAGTKTPLVNYSGIVQPIKSADNALIPSLGGSGVVCVQTDNTGQITASALACGTASSFTNPAALGPVDLCADSGAPYTTTCPNSLPEGTLYLRHDTGWAYTMWTLPSAVPARVQEAASLSFSATLGAAPTVGNYLVAIGYGQTALPTLAAGWTNVATQTGDNSLKPYARVAYHFVVPGDTTAQTPFSGSVGVYGGVTVIEVSGLDPVWANSYQATVFAQAGCTCTTTTSTASATTTSANTLGVASAYTAQNTTNGGIPTLNAGWTHTTGATNLFGDGSDVIGSQAFVSSSSSVTATGTSIAAGTQAQGITTTLVLLQPAAAQDTGQQQVSYLTTIENSGVTITPSVGGRTLNFSTGLTATSDATGNVTIVSSGVTSVTCGSGLTGGTITSTGTCAISAPVSVANGGTGQTTYTDGQLLIGDSSTNGLDKATLTAGTNISITNGHGSITITGTGGGGGGTVTSVTCSQGLTGGAITVSGTCGLVGSLTPQGRLTLVTGTPVMTSDQTAKSQVFYDCYIGKAVPYFDGSNDQAETISSCEVSTTMQTSGTGVTNNAGVFDVWWVHSGANRICVATNGSGGGWASDTGGSNTARGTGYSQVHNTRGYWTNVNSIAHCYNGATDYGSISADQATYLGSLFTTAAGQTGVAQKPAAAAGGGNNVVGLWNAYNRVPLKALSRDSTASWTLNSSTWRVADNSSSNRISIVDGLQQSSVRCSYGVLSSGTNTSSFTGCNLDSTTAAPGVTSQGGNSWLSSEETFYPQIGLHFYQAMESTSVNQSFFGAQSTPTRQLNELVIEADY